MIENRYRNRSQTKYLPRDELEYLLFAARFLVDRRDSDPYVRYNDTQLLLGLCRMVRGTKGETLRYLRRFYDASIQAQMELKPTNAKELIEIAWEAGHGQAYRKPAERLPIFAYYTSGRDSYIFLDFPNLFSLCPRTYFVTMGVPSSIPYKTSSGWEGGERQ